MIVGRLCEQICPTVLLIVTIISMLRHGWQQAQ